MSPRIDRSFSMTRGDSADDGTPGSPNREDGFFCVVSTIISRGALCMFTRNQGCVLILELNTLERLINAINSFFNLTINWLAFYDSIAD